MFFELRQYRVKPGQGNAWVRLMEEEIIPFLIAQGMVLTGSFVGEQEEDLYVWIRRFESEEAREALYAKVYQSDRWQNDLSPRVGDMLDREKTVVTRLVATPRSVVQ